jgi:Mrp family chromosome partitioning ATPase
MNKLKSIKSILVTNTRSYADSNSVAADLAQMIAQTGKRVLLVDADVHQPIIHQIYHLPNRVGFSDVLSGERSASEIIQYNADLRISIIPSGKKVTDSIDPEIQSRLYEFLQEQKDLFDKVIIHGPPFFYSETAGMAAAVDGVILLIHPGYAKSETSKAIIEKFQRSGATIIGVVMRNQPKHPLNQSAFIDRLLSFDKGMHVAP